MIEREFLEDVLGLENIGVSGDNWVCSCPFAYLHSDGVDTHPSFTIHKIQGIWHCFTCDKKGTFAELISEILGIPIEQAKKIYTVKKKNWIGIMYDKLEKIFDKASSDLPRTFEVHNLKFTKKFSPEALSFLQKRNITPEIIDYFNLLFCDEGFWKGRIVIPVYCKGVLRGYIARSIIDTEERKYLNFKTFEKTKCLYNIDGIDVTKEEVWLVEGCFDVMNLWRLGVKNVAGIFGCIVSGDQIKLLLEKKIKKIILAFDRDEGGKKAVESFYPYFKFFEHILLFTVPEGYKDPGELVELKGTLSAFDKKKIGFFNQFQELIFDFKNSV